MKVAVVMGGPSQEHEVSLRSGAAVLEGFSKTGHHATGITISKDGEWHFGDEEVGLSEALNRLEKFDVVFIGLHGAFGEDGTLQALLDLRGILYTGSSASSSHIAMNKGVSGELFAGNGLQVPKSRLWYYEDGTDYGQLVAKEFNTPFVVKPVGQGSSVGVSIVHEASDTEAALHHAFLFDQQVVVQDFIAGQEFSCGVLDYGEKQALPPTAIRPTGHEFFTYEEKYSEQGAEEITPAPVSAELTERIQQAALQAHALLGCRDYSRTDVIVNEKEELFVIETNTHPGLTTGSLLPKQIAAAGMKFEDFLDGMVQAAAAR